jgi:uncharacterized membrane protein
MVRTTSLLAWLPDPVEWYFRPTPGRTNFTLFPWVGFVFAGAAVGETVVGVRTAERALRDQLALGACAVLIAWLSYRAAFLPSIYPHAEFWTSSPTFFFLRVGLITLLLPLAFLWDRLPWRGVVGRWSPVEELGKASLFVYWIHVEMVYGFISRPLRRSLSFEAVIFADLLFSAFLLGIVLLKNRWISLKKAPSLSAAGPAPAAI